MTEPLAATSATGAPSEIGVIMNGVTGRMGYRQHLVRSILAIRDQGGVLTPDGARVAVRPLLVGRSADKLAEVARRHDITDFTTDLDAALADPRWQIYADFLVTQARTAAIRRAIAAGKAIYTEKPTAETLAEALDLARLARDAHLLTGVVHDKLYLPGLLKLRRLLDTDFFGRVLSIRLEFGYWVFDGQGRPAQRPSWNYKADTGGGIVSDMFPHWSYVLEDLFGPIETVYAQTAIHLPQRWDEAGQPYTATAEDAAYAIFELAGGTIAQLNSSWTVRVNRDELVELQVDGTDGSAVIGLFGAKVQPLSGTPLCVWNPDEPDGHDYPNDWDEVGDDERFENGFRAQWEDFLTSYATGTSYPYDLLAGARGVQVAQAGLQSARSGCKVSLPRISLD